MLLPFIAVSQGTATKNTEFKHQIDWDTTYIYKYKSKLIVGIFQSYRDYQIYIQPRTLPDSASVSEVRWTAPSNQVTGIDLNFDKFGVSFGVKSVSRSDQIKTGTTSHFNLGFNFGGNRWLLETAYMSFKGFYDDATPTYDTNYSKSGVYTQNPELSNSFLKIKFWYISNHHKFAFKSGYGGMYRQLKTRSTFLFGGNIRFNDMYSGKSLIPAQMKKYYNNNVSINELSSVSLTAFAGAAVNLVVFKAFFMNMAFVFGPDFQSMSINSSNSTEIFKRSYVSLAGEFRFAMGINLKRMYYTVTNNTDFIRYINQEVTMKNRLISHSLNIGFRIGVHTPSFYRKFQDSKLYGLF
ncbi:MAG TPA: DUF4421 family protein [Bacteroidia bacterium]|nr:DUF4421 family protein [Bacteroidia bacterium]